MTMFGSFFVFAIVLFVSGATLVKSRTLMESISPEPSSHDKFSPLAPSPQLSPAEAAHNNYLESCAATLTEKCGEEIFSFVFEDGTSYTDDCCRKLVSTGKECDIAMVKYSIGLPQFEANASIFLSKSEQLWNKCSSVSVATMVMSRTLMESISPEPYSHDEFSPLAPSPQLSPAEAAQNNYLESCAAKLTEKCGEESFSFVFENGTSYTDDCCRKLVSMGKECDIAIVKYSVGLPQFEANASIFLSKSEQLWNKCSSVA